MHPLPIVASALLAPGDLGYADFLQGISAVVRLPSAWPVNVGAPVPEPLALPADFPCPLAPRALLLAVAVGQRLELEPGPNYGLVLALSSLHADPAYVEHMLAYGDRPEKMADVQAYREDFPLAYVARSLAIEGPRVRLDTACASGSDALILAYEWIEAGYADDVLVVAASSMLNPIGLALFRNLRALNTADELTASRPFDRQRQGFVMGEGAAALWLSKRLPRPPLGFVCSYGKSMNAFKLTDMPADTGPMETACRQALDGVDELAYISAHGTSTPANDLCETRLYKELFRQRAHDIPISALKSMTGHCLGASSLIEVAITVEVLRHGRAPPTANLVDPDPECDLNYLALNAESVHGNFALSNAFAFGGHNSSILLSKEAP